ncbi:MAG TPA: glycosyltransferase family 39 protein [Ktedonobacterales bacterium]
MVTSEVRVRPRIGRLTAALLRARTFIARDPIIFVVIWALAFCFYLYALGKAAIWYDESFSAIFAIQPLPVLWNGFDTGETNMVLYYVILHGWVHVVALFGVTATELVLRLPSAVFAALSAGVVFLLGRRFASKTAGIAAAVLYLFNRYPLYAAHQARAYGLQLLLICLSWYALLTLITGSKASKRWWACFIAVSALAIYAHVLSLLILLTQGAVICLLCIIRSRVQTRARSLLLPFAGAYVLIGLVIIPLMSASGRNPTKTLWLGAPQLSDLPHLYIVYVSSGGGLARLIVGAALLAGLAAWVISRSAWGHRLVHSTPVGDGMSQAQSDKPHDRVPLVVSLVCWLLIPVMASYIASRFTTQHVFSDRYLMTIVPAIDLALGLGISALTWRWARAIVFIGLAVGTLAATPSFYATEQLGDWRTPTNWLAQHFQRGDGVVCDFKGQYAPGCQNYEFEYYLYYFHASDLANYVATDRVPNSSGADAWVELAAYAAQHPRLYFVAGDVGSARDAAQQQAVQQWLDSHYRLVDQVSSMNSTVRLYDTGRSPTALRSPPMLIAKTACCVATAFSVVTT